MDLSVLKSNDPAGFAAEKSIKQRIAQSRSPDADPATWERTDHRQGHQQNPGSIAASDSGQFHAYRKNRRHEIDRLTAFEEAKRREGEEDQFKREVAGKQALEEAKTAKRRAKRQKNKNKKVNINKS
jgi:hypothetical protein